MHLRCRWPQEMAGVIEAGLWHDRAYEPILPHMAVGFKEQFEIPVTNALGKQAAAGNLLVAQKPPYIVKHRRIL
jgi:hypothetical protein